MGKQHGPAPSQEAMRLHRESYVVDLHVDTLYIQRVYGYDPARRHRPRIPYSPFFNHADLPRMIQGSIDGVGLGIVLFPFFTSLSHRVRIVSRTVSDLLNLAYRTRQVRSVRIWRTSSGQERPGRLPHSWASRAPTPCAVTWISWTATITGGYGTRPGPTSGERGRGPCQGVGRQEGVRPTRFGIDLIEGMNELGWWSISPISVATDSWRRLEGAGRP